MGRATPLLSGVFVVGVVLGCSSTEQSTPPSTQSRLEDHWYNNSVARPLFGDFDSVLSLQLVPSAQGSKEIAQRGEYLTKHVAACGACHGKRTDDPASPLSGGHVLYDRFGEVRAANITPDKKTGIGTWSMGEIMRAMRASIDRSGRPLSIDVHQQYRWLSDQDARAIAFYLLTTQPVRRTIERRFLGPFERNRFALFPQHTDFQGYVPELSRGNELAYGRYLARNVAQCYSCHTAPETLLQTPIAFGGSKSKYEAFSDLLVKNLLSGEKKTEPELLSPEARQELENSAEKKSLWWGSEQKSEEQAVHAPDIRAGLGAPLGDWNESAIVEYLSSGLTPTGDAVDRSHCPWGFYSAMSVEDKTAIAKFLKSLT